ncbi:hypothetical protein HDU76_002568 [Blyttiomyces sp. JEL0837]|nr:hypothetical protein HDU76_002568 [Blyttiomyces sp. JEL0837]
MRFSLWDFIPQEIRELIIKLACDDHVFTRYLHSKFTNSDIEKYGSMIWDQAFAVDFQGDLSILPNSRVYLPKVYTVQSRSMYHRLRALRPDLASTDPILKHLEDDQQWKWVTDSAWSNTEEGKGSMFLHRAATLRQQHWLIHIPLRNGWLDELPSWMTSWQDETQEFKLRLFTFACMNGGLDLILPRLDDLKDNMNLPTAASFALIQAATRGYADIVKILLGIKGIDVNVFECAALLEAARNGHREVVRLLLTVDDVFDNLSKNKAFREAAANGHLDVVKFMLEVEGVNPASANDFALRWAARNGHIDVVKLLASVPRVDPTADNNFAVRWASTYGRFEVVQFLLGIDGVNAGAHANEAIRRSSENGHYSVVQLLLKDPKVDPAALDNIPIRYASEQGHAKVVKLLLDSGRVDPSADSFSAIRIAAANDFESK